MGLHHRISAKFKSGVEPAAEDKEVKIRYLSGANWKNKKYEGGKGKKGSEKRTKRAKGNKGNKKVEKYEIYNQNIYYHCRYYWSSVGCLFRTSAGTENNT